MKLKILAVGLIAVVAVLIMLAASGVFTSPFFEEKTQFGAWGQDVRVLYEDGTSESLAILINKPLSVLTYNSKPIIGFDYSLAVKVTGTGFIDSTVTLGSYVLNVSIRKPVDAQKPGLGSTVKSTTSYTLISGENTVPIDSAFHPIGGTAVFQAKTKLDAVGLASDVYYIEFVPTGTVTYKGNPNGDVQTASLPAAISVTVSYAKGTLSVEVTGGPTSH